MRLPTLKSLGQTSFQIPRLPVITSTSFTIMLLSSERNMFLSMAVAQNLPLPESPDELSVPRAYNALIRLIDHIGGTRISEYDTYFRRAGFQVVEGIWPSSS